MERTQKIALFVVLAVLVAVRLYHLDAPPLEIEESWRQADTESIARNFVEYDFNILHPNLNYDGPLPNVPALEFQVTTFLTALLYRVFGYHYFLARLVPLCFFTASAVYLYLFAGKYLGPKGALFSLAAYGAVPINVYYSRAIMPESAGLLFFIGSFYYFDRWTDEKNGRFLILSSLFLALALMTKPPTVFIAIPMLYLCFSRFGWKWLTFPRLWVFALVTAAVPLAYYYYSISTAEFKFALGITQKLLSRSVATAFFSEEALFFYLVNLPKALTVFGLLLVLGGIATVRKREAVIVVWFAAILLEVFLIVSNIKAYYYLIFFVVPCCLLNGSFLEKISRVEFGTLFSVLLLMLIIWESFYISTPMYRINRVMETQVKVVEQLTAKNDLLVVGSYDPCLLSISGRRGWRFNIHIYPDIPRDPVKELNYYIQNGAKYFVPIQGKVYGDTDKKIIKYLEENYSRLEIVEGYPIYQLR